MRASTGKWLAACAALAFAASASGADWPQWRGSGRDGIAYDFKAPKIWPQMLTKVWSVKAGDGLASPVVVGDRVYLHTRQGDNEVVSAFALASGQLLWSDSYRSPFTVEPQLGSYGPYATPAVDGGRLYTFGMNEVLSAYDTASGKLLWRKDWGTEYKVPHPDFGAAAAPLVADGLSIVHVGGRGKGALVALDAKTGEPRWKVEGDGPSYAATITATFDGVRQVIAQSESILFGVELATGKRLWELPWRSPSGNTILTPVIDGDRFILSTQDTDVQSIRPFKKDGAWTTETVWSSRDGKMFMSSPVLSDGRLYGFSTRQKGTVYSLDPATGKLLWSSPGAMGENAMMVAAGEYLFVLLDTADLYVARKGGEAWAPVARFHVADSATYTYPVILGDRILIRDRYGLTLWSLEGWGFSLHGAWRGLEPDDADDPA
jgi:outer membrane protein assembly factor BamB